MILDGDLIGDDFDDDAGDCPWCGRPCELWSVLGVPCEDDDDAPPAAGVGDA